MPGFWIVLFGNRYGLGESGEVSVLSVGNTGNGDLAGFSGFHLFERDVPDAVANLDEIL